MKGKEKEKNRSRTDKAVCREISPCSTRWLERKKKLGRGPFVQQVLDFVLFRFVPRGGVLKNGRRRKKEKKTTYVDHIPWLRDEKLSLATRWLFV